MTDTIAAIATPPGQGAIALLRISGPESRSLLESLLPSALELRPRCQTLATMTDPGGEVLDEVLICYFPAPHSYTGEDVVEISCHGGNLVTQAILGSLLSSGARAAEPGEFTQRAFLNEKLDLTQAEAVMDLISAQTGLARKTALAQLQGKLGRKIESLREDLIGILAHVEAFIDFPDEDIDPDTGAQLGQRIQSLLDAIEQLAATADQGRILREGVRTVICGAPNAGKSSLLNLLTGFDRAIVTSTAGTTRDTIEETINLDGIPLRLIDTAGLRDSSDPIEQEGVSRSSREIEQAELVLEVLDGHDAPSETAVAIQPPVGTLHVRILNKADLGIHSSWEKSGDEFSLLSCSTGSGLEELKERIVQALFQNDITHANPEVTVNARHLNALQSCAHHLRAAHTGLQANLEPELVAVDLRSALQAVGDILGKTDIEEILGEIFRSFCIGK